MLTLRIQQMTINGHPYRCPECASEAFTLDGTGFIDALPVRGNCWLAHSWEEPLITLGDLKVIDAVRTGRERAEDDDIFEIVIGGALLAGILHPEVTADDIKRAARDVLWKRVLKPGIRKQRRRAVRAVTKPVKKAAKGSVAYVQAAALETAWGWQAGGHQPDPDYTPEPVNACPAGCTNGFYEIDSKVHTATRIRCAVCRGTGEID